MRMAALIGLLWSEWKSGDVNVHKHDARLTERVNGVRECSLHSLDHTVHGATLVQGQMEDSSGFSWSFSSRC